MFYLMSRQGANGFVKIEPKYMKYGFEISDFSATIYNIISANFTINLGVNVRGWGQNEQIVTKYRSWCRGSQQWGGWAAKCSSTHWTHWGWKTGGKMRCSGRAFRLQIWDELSPCIRVIRLGPVTSTAASFLPARGTSSFLHTAVVQFRSEKFLWYLVDNINPLNPLYEL